mmetsp:Transcript_11383/g.23037  ORF Transcript_11383/g.23037 Transcript_11383/m.23037 type:complete len:133 (+) Transcript_11383:1430-1828(+)
MCPVGLSLRRHFLEDSARALDENHGTTSALRWLVAGAVHEELGNSAYQTAYTNAYRLNPFLTVAILRAAQVSLKSTRLAPTTGPQASAALTASLLYQAGYQKSFPSDLELRLSQWRIADEVLRSDPHLAPRP